MKKQVKRCVIAIIALVFVNLLIVLVTGSKQDIAKAAPPDPGLPGPYSVSVGIDEQGDESYIPPSIDPHAVELRSAFYYPTGISGLQNLPLIVSVQNRGAGAGSGGLREESQALVKGIDAFGSPGAQE